MTRHANINYPQQTIKAALGGGLPGMVASRRSKRRWLARVARRGVDAF